MAPRPNRPPRGFADPLPNPAPLQDRRPACRAAAAVLLAVSVLSIAAGSPAPASDPDWPDLAELGQIEIAAVSKRPQAVWSSPAAVSVLTAEDIAATGATTIPDALRWVPGLNVAQIDSNTWAIGARGFQWQYANKLLVMIDGRPVYSPVTGGVRWQDNTTFLDDIERIEVVRGPGSSVWGANAVNGVIDIVTRSAFDTLGTHVYAAAGDGLPAATGVRQGIRLSPHAALRVYGLYRNTGDDALPGGGAAAADDARLSQGGFRLDWQPSATDTVTLQGDGYRQSTDYVRTLATLSAPPAYAFLSTAPIRSRGANVLGRWRHEFGHGGYLEGQTFWDRVASDRPQVNEKIDTLDTVLTAGARAGERQEFTAGLSYRFTDGRLEPGLLTFFPAALRTRLFGAFVQDQIALVPGRWTATAGARLEHNNFTGWEPQPTVRFTYTPSPDRVFWGSWAQAVRTPTWTEEISAFDAQVFPPGAADPALPLAIRLLGNRALKAERLTAFELGWRWRWAERVSVEAALFSYQYLDYVLATDVGLTLQAAPAALVRNTQYQNGLQGETYGGELAVRWSPAAAWQLFASYSYVNIQLHTRRPDPFGFEQDETTTPRNVVRLQSSLRFGRRWQLDLAGRYVDPVRYYAIPAYSELDARLAWKTGERWQVALVGRNLLHDHHLEYDSALDRKLIAIRREVFVLVRTDF